MITGIIYVKFVQSTILMDAFWYEFFLSNTASFKHSNN